MDSGAYSAPSATMIASPDRERPSTSTVRPAGSIRVMLPRINSTPWRSIRESGRLICALSRSPTISQSREGGKTCSAARSIITTRSSRGNSLRSVSAATMPPMPAPRIRTVRLMMNYSKNDDFVGPLCPGRQLVHCAAVRALHEIAILDAAGVDAGAADADHAARPRDHAHHVADVVVARRHFLPGLGAGGGISDQKYLDLFAFFLGQGAGKTKRGVAALCSGGRIVKNKQVSAHERISIMVAEISSARCSA